MRVKVFSALILAAACAAAQPSAPRHFLRDNGPLTEPSGEAPDTIGRAFLKQAAALYGVPADQIESAYLVRQFRTEHNGVTHLRYRQRFAGADVLHSDFVINIDREGRILNAGGALFSAPDPKESTASDTTLIPAIRAAMNRADPSAPADFTPIEIKGPGKIRRFHRQNSGDIDARPVWTPVDGKLKPAWQFVLSNESGAVEALTLHSGTEALLESQPLTFYQNPPAPPRGSVFTRGTPQPNPRPGFAKTEPPPYVQREVVSFAGDPQASPSGWVTARETAGNNIVAGSNPLGIRFAEPVTAKSSTRDFQFPLELGPQSPNPTNFVDAATTNLFYWLNLSHDLFWHAGFNEASGNFQLNNFGRGGAEGDALYAYAQFGVQQPFSAGINNAFYTTRTLEDGSPAMIAMFLGAGSNGVITDGSYESEVSVHEYTHGVSNRLVANLSGHQGGAMGEAWSDFFALEFTVPEGAPPDGVYPSGDYFIQTLNTGIRTRTYSTRMEINPITYADLGRVALFPAIHQDGGIWVEALWEMRANLIAQFGETEGRRRTRMLVIDGMKLSVPGPTMVDARDAILLADRAGFRGESQSQIWAAFAKRGLGATAFSASNNQTRVTASFTRPSDTAALAFSQPEYVFGEPIRVILYDGNLTGDVAVVQLTSYETGDLETLRLRRDGPFFTGLIPTSHFAPGNRDDGGLSVMPGSIVSAYYNDRSAAGGAPKLVEISVPMRPNYIRLGAVPSFQFANEQPVNLRAGVGATLLYELPWEFPFYGRNYSALRIHPTGLLSFDLPPAGPCLDLAQFRQVTGIAPFWMDLRTSGSAQPNENVYVSRPNDDAITFRWAAETAAIPGLGTPEPVNFAATLNRSGRIEFNYGPGNRNLGFTSLTSIAFGCGASPVAGISNGTAGASVVATEYLDRSSLENAPSLLLEPPQNAASTPVIRIESPNAESQVLGVLEGRAIVSDEAHLVTDVYVLIDGVLRGRGLPSARQTVACSAQPLPNCAEFTFNFDLQTMGIAPGRHRLVLRASNTRGGVGEQETTFEMRGGQSSVPVIAIESPEAGSEVSALLTVRGYVLASSLQVTAVDILIDGVTYGRAQYGQPRPDICSALSVTAPNCPTVGFTFSLNSTSNFIPLPNGEHKLQVRVQDQSGRFTTYPEQPLMFRVNNAANLPPTGRLVTPAAGEQISGTVLVYGYAWDPDGRIAAVQLLVDGSVREALPYGEARTSECAALPEVDACPGIGFGTQFNSKTLLNGPHVLGIRLVDNAGRAVTIPQEASAGRTIIVRN